MIIEGNKIYGTLKECVEELFKRIENCGGIFPEFDFCADCLEEAKSMKEAYNSSSGWFGCKDISELFDNTQSYSLVLDYYGGGATESADLDMTDREDMEIIISRIGSCTDNIGYGVLNPNDYTIFEFKERKE